MRKSTHISLGRGNRRNCVSEPRMGAEGNMSDQVMEQRMGSVPKETTGKRGHLVVLILLVNKEAAFGQCLNRT